jgi:predicted nucleotidyltransferase
LTSVEIKSVDKAQVRASADEWAARLLEQRLDVVEIVVFGSFEQDTYVPGSDLDVFVLLDHADQPVRERIPDLIPDRFPVGIDLFPYTPQEVDALTPSPVLEAVQRSRWRYTRQALREAALQRFARWESEHPQTASPGVNVALVGALYGLLPLNSRCRPPEVGGVVRLHALLRAVDSCR